MTEDGRYVIELKGLIRFKVIKEIKSQNIYREYEAEFKDYYNDQNEKKEERKFTE